MWARFTVLNETPIASAIAGCVIPLSRSNTIWMRSRCAAGIFHRSAVFSSRICFLVHLTIRPPESDSHSESYRASGRETEKYRKPLDSISYGSGIRRHGRPSNRATSARAERIITPCDPSCQAQFLAIKSSHWTPPTSADCKARQESHKERRLASRPKPFRAVRMHPLLDLLDRRLVRGNIENLLRARIPREHAVARIVLPPPELGCVHGKLQTRLARLQGLLRLLARVNIQDHGCVAQRPAGPVADDVGRHPRPNHVSVFTDEAVFHVENG